MEGKMTVTERQMIKMLTGKDFGSEIEELSALEGECRRYNRREGSSTGRSSQTRLLGRYRSMKLRKSRLDLKIRERLAFLAEAKKRGVEPSWLSFGREKNSILDMIRETVTMDGRLRACEAMAEGLPKELKRAAEYRYLDMSVGSMPDWQKTAENTGFQGSGEELRKRVTRALEESGEADS